MIDLTKGLNENQREVVTAPPSSDLLVLAGAGSGKTRVLVNRIAWLIRQHGFPPHAVLAVTFTNKAAGEMKSRLSQLIDTPLWGMWVGTFHGLCHRLLRRHHSEANLPEQFHILDSDDQLKLIKRIMLSLNLDEAKWPVKEAQRFINAKKEEGIRANQIKDNRYGALPTLIHIYKEYERYCQTSGLVDFSELLLRAYDILKDNPSLLAHYQQRFQAILVDEFQDTNTIQYAWIKLLTGENTTVMVVGDDDQSIYSWRGAKVANLQQFSKDFSNVQVIRLEQNYRSTSNILAAANALIENNDSRLGKTLWTEGEIGEKILTYSAFNELEEARFVCECISKEVENGCPLNEIAILYRSNAQSRVFEETLLRAGITYRIHGGLSFFERTEIKHALAYLRLLANPLDDTAFERVVNFPTRGIGDKTLEEIRQIGKSHRISLWKASLQLLDNNTLSLRAQQSLQSFINLILALQTKIEILELDELLKLVLQESQLYSHYAKIKADRSESRLENLQELINAAKQFRYEQEIEKKIDENPISNSSRAYGLISFLAYISLEAQEMQNTEEDRAVQLMTLHAAKGLEFPVVFLVGLEEGLFPSKQSMNEPGRLEEERRLCYVGMTRAMQKLIITYAEVRRQYGREEYHRPSRFLKEIPTNLLNRVGIKMQFKSSAAIPSHFPAKKYVEVEQESGLQLGQQVKHPKFGQGIVTAVEGSGAHTRVEVRFSEQGSKWLILAYANLIPA